MMIRSNNMKKWFVLVALVLVIVASGEAWGIRAASAAPTAKSIKLRMMLSAELFPDQLSPINGFLSSMSDPIVFNVMEPLVAYTKDGPVPKLATKWEQRNPTTWRFYLRRGVKFHNGANFTAQDVVEYVKWNFEEKNLSKTYQRIPVQKAIAVDDYTVDLIFEKPQPLLLIVGRGFLIPPLAISRDNREMAKTNPIGTGPYRFVEWKMGQHIKLTKFDGYWGPKPQIDDVEILFRQEVTVRVAALIAGEVDWIYALDTEQANRVPKVARMASPDTVFFRFDEAIQKEFTGKDPILADKRLRLAVEYAIDRQALVSLYKGFATPSLGQFASPGEFGFNPGLKSRPYDLEKAKTLVREAGAVGKTLNMVCATDRWIKGTEIAEAVAYMIEKTGLKVKLGLMPHEEMQKSKEVLGENRKYVCDIVLSPTDCLLEVETRLPYLFVWGGRYSATPDPEITRLYKEVLPETDYTKRAEKVAKVWGYLYEQAHYVPLFKLPWIWGLAKNLEWRVDITGIPFFADMRFTD